MYLDDTERDPVLQRHLVLLSRHQPPSPEFTDRVVADLLRRGLVQRAPTVQPRWLAAAAVIFALGLGAGAMVNARRAPTAQSIPPVAIGRIAADVNVPSPGKSEVWF